MALVFYWYPKCGTCRKAKKWLDEHGIAYDAIHIVENPPSKEQLKDITKGAGLSSKSCLTQAGENTGNLV